MQRTAVYVLCVDLERPDSREALREAIGERACERACQTARGQFLAVWLGVRGSAHIHLADEIDLLLLERLVIDLADGLGLIELMPLQLSPSTVEAMRQELERFYPSKPAPAPRPPRLRLVADNTGALPRVTTVPDEASETFLSNEVQK